MNIITIPSFTEKELLNLIGESETKNFLLMWKTRLYNSMKWEDGFFTFRRPKDSKNKDTIEVHAKKEHDNLYNFLMLVVKYNLENNY